MHAVIINCAVMKQQVNRRVDLATHDRRVPQCHHGAICGDQCRIATVSRAHSRPGFPLQTRCALCFTHRARLKSVAEPARFVTGCRAPTAVTPARDAYPRAQRAPPPHCPVGGFRWFRGSSYSALGVCVYTRAQLLRACSSSSAERSASRSERSASRSERSESRSERSGMSASPASPASPAPATRLRFIGCAAVS